MERLTDEQLEHTRYFVHQYNKLSISTHDPDRAAILLELEIGINVTQLAFAHLNVLLTEVDALRTEIAALTPPTGVHDVDEFYQDALEPE